MPYRAIAPLRGAASQAARRHAASPHVAAPQPAQPQLPDWQSDPVLQRIIAQQQAAVAQAQAAAIAGRQQAEINYGYDPGYAYADENTRRAAQQNPFSVLSMLSQQHQTAGHNIDESRNRQNAFYSSARVQDLGNEGQNYLQRQYEANQALHGQLSGIAGQLLAAQTGADSAIGQGESDAYGRGLNFQLQYGGYPTQAVARPAAARPRATHLLAHQARRSR